MANYPEHKRWAALFELFKACVQASMSKVDIPPLRVGASFTLTSESADIPHLFVAEYGQRMVDFCAELDLDMCPLVVETTYLCKRGFAAVIHDSRQNAQHRSNLIIHIWRKEREPAEEVA